MLKGSYLLNLEKSLHNYQGERVWDFNINLESKCPMYKLEILSLYIATTQNNYQRASSECKVRFFFL